MGSITIKRKYYYDKTKTKKDKYGRLHCKTCGAFISKKGKKK